MKLRRTGLLDPRLLLFGLYALAGCASTGFDVSAEDVPRLAAALAASPQDSGVSLKYAAALFAAGNCRAATVAAKDAARLQPSSEIPVLILGQCMEEEGRFEAARSVYSAFLIAHPDIEGSEAVRAREEYAARGEARVRARAALEGESDLPMPDPQAMAVLPWDVGEGPLQPLAVGLAQLVTSDLVLLSRFPLVERVRLGALLDELSLGQTERVAPATAPRIGRLTGAGRLLQGSLDSGDGQSVRLTAQVVAASGEVELSTSEGDLGDLLGMEKELVLELARSLGYELTSAERALLLDNGTRNVQAFLAFSEGLIAESTGDFTSASAHFTRALRADPGFGEARQRLRTTAAARVAERSTRADVSRIGDASDSAAQDEEANAEEPATDSALTSSIGDVAATQAEAAGPGSDGGSDATKQIGTLGEPLTPVTPPKATIRIRVRIPGEGENE